MIKKFDDSFDPNQPALLVLHGSTGKKHRPLNRPVLVLGKARGCDIGLLAPDVSYVHCVISRTPTGFHLRDCASRAGTRLNGSPVMESMLRDDDILQIGPFSFQVYLPATCKGLSSPHCTSAREARLSRSRRRLVRLALRLRRQVRELDQVQRLALTHVNLAVSRRG